MSKGSSYQEYDLYLPVLLEPGASQILKKLRSDLTDFFGGLTITNFEAAGEWRVGPVKVKDRIQIWRILSDRGMNGENFLKQVKVFLERELRQEKILIVKRQVQEL